MLAYTKTLLVEIVVYLIVSTHTKFEAVTLINGEVVAFIRIIDHRQHKHEHHFVQHYLG